MPRPVQNLNPHSIPEQPCACTFACVWRRVYPTLLRYYCHLAEEYVVLIMSYILHARTHTHTHTHTFDKTAKAFAEALAHAMLIFTPRDPTSSAADENY